MQNENAAIYVRSWLAVENLQLGKTLGTNVAQGFYWSSRHLVYNAEPYTDHSPGVCMT
jgi:hypothetical protein